MMKKVEAIIRPAKLEAIKDALGNMGIHGMTVSNVLGCGLQKGRTDIYRGNPMTVYLLPKIKIEVVVPDEVVEEVIPLIIKEAWTGEVGDGKIFLSEIQNVIRVRTGESGNNAV